MHTWQSKAFLSISITSGGVNISTKVSVSLENSSGFPTTLSSSPSEAEAVASSLSNLLLSNFPITTVLLSSPDLHYTRA